MGALVATLLATSGAAFAQDNNYEIAVIRWDPADIYFNGVQFGQELERQRIEKEEGVSIEFRVTGANDVSAQRNGLDAQLARGVDGVLLVPWRGEAMRGIVTKMREDGVPVVTSNAWVPDAPQTFVAFDNEAAGRLAGEALVARLDELRGENWRDEGGVIIELRCIITASFDIGRHTSYRSVFDPIAAENPNVVIEEREAGCDGGDARKAVDDLVSRYGGEKILAVASIDGTVPELQALARGEIDHVSVQPAIGEGIMSMRLLWEMIKSGGPLKVPESEVTILSGSDALWAPVQIIPSENFDGAWYKTSVYAVPGDVAHDNSEIWSTQVYKRDNGEMPKFAE
jgi:ribose transport system substrate-binding protein